MNGGASWTEGLTEQLTLLQQTATQLQAALKELVARLRPAPPLPAAASPPQGDERQIRRYQLEQAVKQLVLVEGHLTDARTAGSPLCCHCVAKHAFALQALAEESAGILADLAPTFRDLGRWAQEVQGEGDRCQLGDADLTRLTERARAFRKALMAALDPMAFLVHERDGAAPAPAAGHLAGAPPRGHLD